MTDTKVLVLAEGSIYERQGQFNAALNRTKYLIGLNQCSVDMMLLSSYEPWHVRTLRHHAKMQKPGKAEIDGVSITIDWENFSLIDYVLTNKLHRSGVFGNRRVKRLLPILRKYDFVVAHSFVAAEIAMLAKQKYDVPFSVTWHGSDIHTYPFSNPSVFDKTKSIIECADTNIYVSKALLQTSNKITERGHKDVLYNGCDTRFHKYDEHQRSYFRKKFDVEGKKVVTFVGNFFEVKNILLIPHIFRAIYEKDKNVVFWMLGDGKYRAEVEKLIEGLPVKLWGNQPPELIPDYLNCTDVQILPSKNEGLPLTMVEALRCGCHAVGSLVGGIPEVIGTENCVSLDSPTFVQDVVDKVLYFLGDGANEAQIAAPHFDWDVTARKEIDIINGILSKSK